MRREHARMQTKHKPHHKKLECSVKIFTLGLLLLSLVLKLVLDSNIIIQNVTFCPKD